MNLSPKVLEFLRQLTVNNNREWFKKHKVEYEEAKVLFEDFIDAQIRAIVTFDPQVKGLKAKDCTFRIYRDVRFGKDKTPYKISFGAYMAREGRKGKNAGYYTHIEPDNSFVAGGLHCPDKHSLHRVRMAIHKKPKEFSNLITSPRLRKIFPEIHGEQLKVAPKGFDKNLKHIDFLRYKSYDFIKKFSDEDILSDNYFESTMDAFRPLSSINSYFNEVL